MYCLVAFVFKFLKELKSYHLVCMFSELSFLYLKLCFQNVFMLLHIVAVYEFSLLCNIRQYENIVIQVFSYFFVDGHLACSLFSLLYFAGRHQDCV